MCIRDSAVTNYSNAGDLLDILAPADPVYTADIVGFFGYTAGDYFPYFNGTSSACPFAAGCVASIQNAARQRIGRFRSPAEVKELLIRTGDPITDTKVDLTKPRVNLGAAVMSPFGPPIYLSQNSVLNGWVAPESDNYDAWQPAWWGADVNVLEVDPLFVSGYLLSQIAAGQDVDSPVLDAGSVDANDPVYGFDPDTYTTRTDGVGDVNILDLGYHYPIESLSELTVAVVDVEGDVLTDPNLIHGYVDPNSGLYTDGAVIQLIAHPDPNWRVAEWSGTDDDDRVDPNNTVTMAGDRYVTVRFEEIPKHALTVVAIGPGVVEPNQGMYNEAEVVTLVATPEEGYRVRRWIGADVAPGWNQNTNTVTIGAVDAVVTVEFEEARTRNILVPKEYETIEEAVAAASPGDTNIIISEGVYTVTSPMGIDLQGKRIRIMSTDPNDPNIVAQTVIDCGGDRLTPRRAFHFHSGEPRDCIVTGLTIRNAYWAGAIGGIEPNAVWGMMVPDDPNDLANTFFYMADGADANGVGYGGAILCENASSPTISKCVIEDCTVVGAQGGDGLSGMMVAGDTDGDWGGDGGDGRGTGYGGAIACLGGSQPRVVNCTIRNCTARGGMGGNGGNGGDWDGVATGQANYGGNYSRSQALSFDPNSLDVEFVDGDLWKAWKWDLGPTYGPVYGEPNLVSYFGDYRRYSAYGGGAYCDIGSNVTFINCEIRGNQTFGGMSGVGGAGNGGRNEEPLVAYELPTYGAGVYCAADSTVTFTGCTFENNIASPVDPNNSLDPYLGYGGGVAAEESAGVVFVDCNFVDNEADSGGGIYVNDTDVTIIDCNLAANTALRGGGLAGNSSSIDIFATVIARNVAAADPNDPNDPNGVGAEDMLASGAGLYCVLGGLNVRDCNVTGNVADFSGGGAYVRDVDQASFINNLITNNAAGRDGGGLSINWFADGVIANCTFVGNAAAGTIGQTDKTGFGGGLFTSHSNAALVTDCIFWDNFALKGTAMAVGGNFDSDKQPSTLTVSHSLVKDARAGVWVEAGSTLTWADGNVDDDPRFVTGRLDDYYLSQRKSGQGIDSPGLNAGSDYASAVGLVGYTTRTDDARDEGIVDIGYHHPKEQPCRMGDLVFDGIVNFLDFAKLAESWLDQSCSESNGWCRGADITTDESVDFRDVIFMADCWLAQDTLPPSPNPSEWEEEPNLVSGGAITMTAETSYDAWGWDVEYFFDCVDDKDCHDSGWQTNPTYTDGGLPAGVEFGYRVRTRDGVGNMTEWSPIRYAGLDSTPPAPAPFIETFFAASETSITVTASTVYDDSDVEYYFENTTIDGHDSDWQDDPNYTDPNLLPDTEYSYRVKARDKSPWANETDWSEEITVRTLATPDLDPPDPNPMDWDPVQDANGFDGTPREIAVDPNSQWGYGATMTAVIAVDAGGGPVEYFFECITNSGFNSGWIATETYTVLTGRPGQGHIFRVRARDQFGNMTAWSREERAD